VSKPQLGAGRIPFPLGIGQGAITNGCADLTMAVKPVAALIWGVKPIALLAPVPPVAALIWAVKPISTMALATKPVATLICKTC
jgi:hypothetical protein